MDVKITVEYLRNCTHKSDLVDFEVADFINQQEKYAELAKQAIAELEKYPCKGIVTDECKPEDDFTLVCDNYWFCRLRAELLVEVKSCEK